MRRERVDKLVSAMVEVARDTNTNPDLPHYVRKLSVFGSYSGTDTMLAELSMAYDLGTRHEPSVRNEQMIVACLKLRKGMRVSPHSEVDRTDCAQ
ncbi:MAG: hypothetical protein EOP61_20700, partial [Sphingomonadales bacterium]